MQKDKNRLGKSEKADQKNANNVHHQLSGSAADLEAAKTFSPREDYKMMRRYSIDDNGGRLLRSLNFSTLGSTLF